MKPDNYNLFTVLAQARARPVWPQGEQLAELTALARRFWFVVTESADGSCTISGPTLTEPLALCRDTATIRLLNEVCSAVLSEDARNTIYTLEQPLRAPFVLDRQFLQRRISAFRAGHRGYEATYNALTQPQETRGG